MCLQVPDMTVHTQCLLLCRTLLVFITLVAVTLAARSHPILINSILGRALASQSHPSSQVSPNDAYDSNDITDDASHGHTWEQPGCHLLGKRTYTLLLVITTLISYHF